MRREAPEYILLLREDSSIAWIDGETGMMPRLVVTGRDLRVYSNGRHEISLEYKRGKSPLVGEWVRKDSWNQAMRGTRG